jgi:nucleotide-binding universal stress UspA family protein
MARVLIPFSDLASGQRAVRRLLARPRNPRLEVELLAIVDPLTPGKVVMFVSPALATMQVTSAAWQWLNSLESLLDDAGFNHRSRVAIGRFREILRQRADGDVDEVLLGNRERDPLRGWRRWRIAHMMGRPLATIS